MLEFTWVLVRQLLRRLPASDHNTSPLILLVPLSRLVFVLLVLIEVHWVLLYHYTV